MRGHDDVCVNCGRHYNTHGAPEDVADALGIERNRRHLICRWSDAEWDDFNRARRRASADDFVADVAHDLQRFEPVEQLAILRRLVDGLIHAAPVGDGDHRQQAMRPTGLDVGGV